MDPQRKERIVDEVLDRALGPQLVEPRAGLEERILANLASQPQRRPWWRWIWVPALAAAAVLAVVIGIRVMHREVVAPTQANKTVPTPKQQVAEMPTPVKPERQVAKHVAPRLSAPQRSVTLAKAEPQPPRLDVFPTPVPLSDQERLLLALSRRQRGEVEIAANSQSAERERAQKYFDTGYAPEALNKR